MAEIYFTDLNYSLSNEDTFIEYRLLSDNVERVFSIAGSGARCLPLIARNPKHLDVVDMSAAQNYLVELRWRAVQALSYEEYLFFMGYRGAIQDGNTKEGNRLVLFEKLSLSSEAHQYWLKHLPAWEPKGFILLGKWESHFQKLGKLFREYLQCDFSKVFEAQTLNEQRELYEKHWPHLRWKSFIRVAASEYVFNKFLYKGHFSGQEDRRTDQRPPYQFIMEEFERVFRTQLVRKNYFMQVLFLGKVQYEEGLPLEAQRHIFEAVKQSQTQLHFHVGNLLEILPQQAYNFVSLSDTISYLDEAHANSILQRMHPQTPKDSTVVIRSFLKAPTAIDSQKWHQRIVEEQEAYKADGTGVYNFHIFSKS
ncbi:MAG: DUF3419 family protein [Bdellovibrionia bacterium]